MNIGKQIKELRLTKNIKQEELADYLNVTSQAVSKWETGCSDPDISLLPQIAVYFGVTIDELFQFPYDSQMERIENMFWTERRIVPQTFDLSVKYLEGVLYNNPNDVRATYNLAKLYNHRALSDHALASEYARRALELKPDEKEAWVAYLEANNGVCGDEWYDNHFSVIEFFKDFLNKHPKNFLGLYAVIENLLSDARYDEALPYIYELKDIRDNYQYLVYLGDVAYGKGELQNAITYWNKAVEKSPACWQAYCCRADRLKKLGRYEEAIKDYEYSYTMQESPRITDGLYSLAQVHEFLKDYNSAIQDRERIIACLKQDYNITSGEAVEEHLREIDRLISMS